VELKRGGEKPSVAEVKEMGREERSKREKHKRSEDRRAENEKSSKEERMVLEAEEWRKRAGEGRGERTMKKEEQKRSGDDEEV